VSTIATVARIALGLAFVAAAFTKIGQGRAWMAQAVAVGTPRLVATSLPWVELALGAALVAGLASPWPAVGAIAMLGLFTAWIVSQLAAGRRPPCACFGALSTRPLSWWQVARNGGLVLLGAVSVVA